MVAGRKLSGTRLRQSLQFIIARALSEALASPASHAVMTDAMSKVLRTDRLLLRQWEDEDRQILTGINNDPEVMRYFPRRFTEEESHAFVDINAERIANNGWGSWPKRKYKVA